MVFFSKENKGLVMKRSNFFKLLAAALLACCAFPVSAASKDTIAIVRPAGKGDVKSSDSLLDLIQGPLYSVFNTYSKKYKLVDRMRTEQLKAEQAFEEENLQDKNIMAKFGQQIGAKYILTGILNKTSKGYILDLSITETSTFERIASYYSPSAVSRDDIESQKEIREAAITLLEGSGTKLSAAQKKKIRGVSDSDIDAELNIARGLAAGRAGEGGVINVAAFNYLYKAQNYSQTADEAKRLLRYASNDLGEGIANDFALQKEWKKTLENYSSFYIGHPPFDFYYTIPDAPQNLRTYNPDTFKITFQAGLRWNINSMKVMERVLREINTELNNTGRKETWGFEHWPQKEAIFNNEYTYAIYADVVNKAGTQIASVEFMLKGRLHLNRMSINAECDQEITITTSTIQYRQGMNLSGLSIRVTKINKIDAERAGRDGIVKITMVREMPEKQTRSPTIVAKVFSQSVKNAVSVVTSVEDSNRIELFVEGGPYLGPSAGSIHIGLEYGWQWLEGELALNIPIGMNDPYPAIEGYGGTEFFGGRAALGYSYVRKTWYLTASGGIGWVSVWKTKSGEDSNSSSSEENRETVYLDSIFLPFVQLRFNWAFLHKNGGMFSPTLRVGYRLDFFNADKYDLYFNSPRTALGSVKMLDNLFIGVGLCWDWGK